MGVCGVLRWWGGIILSPAPVLSSHQTNLSLSPVSPLSLVDQCLTSELNSGQRNLTGQNTSDMSENTDSVDAGLFFPRGWFFLLWELCAPFSL